MTRTIPSLNGLRALSILLVLIAHVAIGFGFNSWWIAAYAHGGVNVFFVVSGYLITTLLLKETERTGSVNVKAFYIRRAWRLLPVAYAYLAIITFVHHRQFSWSDIGLSWSYLASYGMAFQSHFPWDLGHLWSLSVEEQFYFVWPLIVAASLRWTKAVAWAAIVIAPLFRYFSSHYGFHDAALFAPPAVVDSIATGCLIALYAKPLAKYRPSGAFWLVAFASPFLLAIADHTRLLWPLPQLLGHCAWTLFNASVGLGILWAIQAKPLVLNHAIANWLGAISYSLYIWHMPFMNPTAQIPFPLNLALAFAAASASYYLLEQPVLRFARNRSPAITYTRISRAIRSL